MQDCCCTNGITTEMPVLFQYFKTRDRTSPDLYAAVKDREELIKACLDTEAGESSTDKVIYRNGLDLMVKIVRPDAVRFIRVAKIVIDQYDLINTFNTIDGNTSPVPRLTYEQLRQLSIAMTDDEFIPPAPEPTPPDPIPGDTDVIPNPTLLPRDNIINITDTSM